MEPETYEEKLERWKAEWSREYDECYIRELDEYSENGR